MPREAHIERQVQWKNVLQKYGCQVKLEESVYIKNARVVVDVYVKAEGKAFLIEIGDIDDERKTALMQYHAQLNPNIEFIHEKYGENKTHQVLESITAYRNSPEYKRLMHQRTLLAQQRKIAEIKDKRNKRYLLYTIISLWLIPTIALIFIDLSIASYWFIGYPFLVFVFPLIMSFFFLFLDPLFAFKIIGFISSIFGSLKKSKGKPITNSVSSIEEKQPEEESEYYDVYGNDWESEDDAFTEEENEDVWGF